MTIKYDPKAEDRFDATMARIAAGLRRAADQVRGGRDPEDVFEELWDDDTDARAAAYDYVRSGRPAADARLRRGDVVSPRGAPGDVGTVARVIGAREVKVRWRGTANRPDFTHEDPASLRLIRRAGGKARTPAERRAELIRYGINPAEMVARALGRELPPAMTPKERFRRSLIRHGINPDAPVGGRRGGKGRRAAARVEQFCGVGDRVELTLGGKRARGVVTGEVWTRRPDGIAWDVQLDDGRQLERVRGTEIDRILTRRNKYTGRRTRYRGGKARRERTGVHMVVGALAASVAKLTR